MDSMNTFSWSVIHKNSLPLAICGLPSPFLYPLKRQKTDFFKGLKEQNISVRWANEALKSASYCKNYRQVNSLLSRYFFQIDIKNVHYLEAAISTTHIKN